MHQPDPDLPERGNDASSLEARDGRGAIADLLAQPRHLTALRLTLLLLLLHGSSSVLLDIPLQILCGVMLISPRLLISQTLWVLVCGVVWWINAKDWLWIDNHKFLISYWCLVCALGVSSKEPDKVLAWNGRLLIGLAFLFATLWKGIAGEYWDGSFLHYTFLTDSRVEAIASLVGNLSSNQTAQNHLLESAVERFPQAITSAFLTTTPQLQQFTWLTSYWTLLIEGSVAIAFLCTGLRALTRLRDTLLLTFIVTTYFLLPVLGFAYVLAIMGFAQCPPQKSRTRIVYLTLILLLQLARLPWENLVVRG